MRTKFRHLRGKLFASYWFVPTLLCALAAVAALLAIEYDQRSAPDTHQVQLKFVHVNTPEGARELLSTIASATITLAGVIFSLTILTISFAASQYGPRLLRNFMRDQPSQLVLGLFAASYLFCLLVLRTIGNEGDTHALPHTAIAGALFLGIVTIAALIFYIHHIARAIQISSVVAGVGNDLTTLARAFLAEAAAGPTEPRAQLPATNLPHRIRIESTTCGHIQALAREDLVALAASLHGTIRMHVAPGDHVTEGSHLADVFTPSPLEPQELEETLRDSVVTGQQRTNEQDLEFPVDQLSEIALRALSPALNDPFTAITCINRLGGSLRQLAAARWPAPVLYDDTNTARVSLLPTSMERLLVRAFDQVLLYGRTNPVIVRQVMKALAEIATHAREPHRRAVLEFADRVFKEAQDQPGVASRTEIQDFHRAIQRHHEPAARRSSGLTEPVRS